MSVPSSLSKFFYFTAFDTTNQNLLYTKHNFDYINYAIDMHLETSNINEIFSHFLDNNGSTFNDPYTVKPELTKYFTNITQEIIDYYNKYGNTIHEHYMSTSQPLTYIDFDILVEQQFMLLNYNDTEIRFIQDYYYIDDTNTYTKWNFDFDTYSSDFKIWGSKMLIFTDFVTRCEYLGEVIKGGFGYGIPSNFKKYFFTITQDVLNYFETNGITSNYNFVTKSVNNIDWNSYYENNKESQNLESQDVDYLKNHFYTKGQYERLQFNFIIPPIDNSDLVYNSIVTIVGNGVASGFLYSSNYDDRIYMITCYHILNGKDNINILRGTISLKNNNDLIIPKSVTADFKIIGYDSFSDVLVSYFDPTLSYNVKNNVDLSIFPLISIDFDQNLIQKGSKAFVISNMKYVNNNTCYSGFVMDPTFCGRLGKLYVVGPPDSIILDCQTPLTTYGSPIILGEPNSFDGIIKCKGMVNSYINIDGKNYTQGINSLYLKNIIDTIIKVWDDLISPITDIDLIEQTYLMKTSVSKKWLGVVASYFNTYLSVDKFAVLSNLPYTGGLVIEDFIIGFNYTKQTFITNEIELSELNVIKLNTPLLNTKIYDRFIFSSKNPIVIKSVTFFNNLISEYKKFYLGKYGEQDTYSNITYGMLPLALKMLDNPTDFLVPYYQEFGKLIIEYFYFNGVDWILEEETIGGNDSDWYNTYIDIFGNKYYEHKFVYPYILLPYLSNYTTQ